MKMGKKSGAEGMSEMTLWSAGDKNKERKAVIAKETRNWTAGGLHSSRPSMIIKRCKVSALKYPASSGS